MSQDSENTQTRNKNPTNQCKVYLDVWRRTPNETAGSVKETFTSAGTQSTANEVSKGFAANGTLESLSKSNY